MNHTARRLQVRRNFLPLLLELDRAGAPRLRETLTHGLGSIVKITGALIAYIKVQREGGKIVDAGRITITDRITMADGGIWCTNWLTLARAGIWMH